MPDAPDGSTSICCDPAYAAIEYHWFRADPAESLIDCFERVLRTAGLPELDFARARGEFASRMLRLRAGALRPIDNVKGPMETVTNMDIFEVRFRIEYGEYEDLRVRLYHVEPAKWQRANGRGSTVLGLHMHAKPDNFAREEQDAEIQIAVDRYGQGRASQWGTS